MQVVLDTSVLLADPDSLEGFPGADIVLPVTVIEELDSVKSRIDDAGASARRVVRRLEEHRVTSGGDLRKAVTLPNGGTLRVELNGLRLEELQAHGLRVERNDNRILAAALGLRAKSHQVTIVSADVNLRVKAAALGVLARDWHPERRQSDVRRGWHDVHTDTATIDAIYGGTIDAPDTLDDIHDNEFVVLRNGSQSALCRYRDGQLTRVRQASAWGLEPRSM